MTTIWSAVGRFFGPSQNDEFAKHLMRLADTAIECAAFFRRTNGQDLKGVIDFEHKGDAIVEEIHELLDNSFIMRFDIPEAMKLTDDLDNVIDGMRKVAFHIDIYKSQLASLRAEALEMLGIAEKMLVGVRQLVGMLSEPRLSLARVRVVARAVDEGESQADRMLADCERKLVVEYSPPGANRLDFIAWQKLFEILENITDDANHCAKLILSMARKEA